jgi:hypothetical protein
VIGQAEIIIAAEIDDFFAIDVHLYLLRTVCDPA